MILVMVTCVPLRLKRGSPNSQCDGVWRVGIWGRERRKWAGEGGNLSDGISILIGSGRNTRASPLHPVGGQERSHVQIGRRASWRTASALILTLSPRTVRNKCCLSPTPVSADLQQPDCLRQVLCVTDLETDLRNPKRVIKLVPKDYS